MKPNRDGELKTADALPVARGRAPFAAAYNLALDVVFPPRCAGCQAWSDDLFCASCRDTLRFLAPPFCARCGLPLGANAKLAHAEAKSSSSTAISGVPGWCVSCREKRRDEVPSFDVVRSPFEFERALRDAVHRFKYNGKTALASPLAGLLETFLRDESVLDESVDDARMSTHVRAMMRRADVIVPVPMHAWRRYRRGYNQSELLARELGRRLNIPLCHALRRARHTAPQVGLSADERAGNVRDAFELRPRHRETARTNTILLIDDVCTTGATLHECARVLKQAGASHVIALTLARQL